MINKNIGLGNLINKYEGCELYIQSEDGLEVEVVEYNGDDIGYISYDDKGKIWGLEVFPEFRGNNYGATILKNFIRETNYDAYKLSPITKELVEYYKGFGFKETNQYECPLSEFPYMELICI
jgi:hypothetical protein